MSRWPRVVTWDHPGLGEPTEQLIAALAPADRRLIGNHLMPATAMGAAHRLLQTIEPQAASAAATFGFASTWLGLWLTGERSIDPTQASYTGLMASTDGSCRWLDDVLDRLGIPPQQLPPVRPSLSGHCQVVDLVWCCQDWSFMASAARYKGYRYPIEVIGHAVWLYHRFTLSLRDVEELMLARGVVVTYETIRSWCAKFGPDYAAQLRRRRPRPGGKWHLDEVFVKINGTTHYLWRAVDQHGDVLDILVQSRRNAVAAKRFFRKLLKGLRYVPRVLVTDKLASYRVAARELLPSVTHRRSKYLNNRAENSHQPTRIRERAMKRFASPGQAQRFLFAFSHIRQHFRPRRHLISAPQWRTEMTNRFAVWDEITVAAAA